MAVVVVIFAIGGVVVVEAVVLVVVVAVVVGRTKPYGRTCGLGLFRQVHSSGSTSIHSEDITASNTYTHPQKRKGGREAKP